MSESDDVRAWLRRAVALAVDNAAGDGGPFGALVVRDGEVVGEGTNRVTATHDPTAHAEVMALRDAGRRTASFELPGCLLVVSCQPCPMCLAAAYWARVAEVVYAATASDAAAAGFDDAFLHEQLRLPADRRDLPTRRVDVAGSRAPFQAWAANPDRTPY